MTLSWGKYAADSWHQLTTGPEAELTISGTTTVTLIYTVYKYILSR